MPVFQNKVCICKNDSHSESQASAGIKQINMNLPRSKWRVQYEATLEVEAIILHSKSTRSETLEIAKNNTEVYKSKYTVQTSVRSKQTTVTDGYGK